MVSDARASGLASVKLDWLCKSLILPEPQFPHLSTPGLLGG